MARHAARRDPRERLLDLGLTLLALLGLTVTGLTLAAQVTGLRPLVVRSGSMSPYVATGSLVLVRDVPATSLVPGDVAAVRRPDGTRVMHRVVTVTAHGSAADLVLRGDANDDVDPAPVTAARAGLLALRLPVVGRLVGGLATAPGGFALGSVVTGAVVWRPRREHR